MYAVVRTGGKQYRVTPGEVIKVERLDGEVGATVALGGDGAQVRVGTPMIDGAKVAAEVLEQAKAPKVIVFKKRRRKNYRRKRGHRQLLTVLRIQDIAVA
jgi:large subunit ribosomal protein L21